MSDSEVGDCDCKVGRSAEKYGLDGLDADLLRRRERDGDSLRDLAAMVNARILAAALDDADASVAGDPASVYEALTGDDVSPERRADVRDQLEYAGVDLDEVEGDFVSHVTVGSHARDCLDIDTSRRGVETVEDGREIVEWARNRDEHIIERTLDQLRRAGAVEAGDLDVTHSVSVTCTDCGATYRVEEFLRDGGCGCDGE